MIGSFRILATVALVGSVSSTASADWEFTSWGMTQDEARVAAQRIGVSVEESSDNYHCSNSYARVAFKVPYQLSDFRAPVCLLFDRETDLLREVMIPLPDPSKKQHVATLISEKYGQPFKTEELLPGILPTTTWLAPDARIQLYSTSSTATLSFVPPKDAVGDGW